MRKHGEVLLSGKFLAGVSRYPAFGRWYLTSVKYGRNLTIKLEAIYPKTWTRESIDSYVSGKCRPDCIVLSEDKKTVEIIPEPTRDYGFLVIDDLTYGDDYDQTYWEYFKEANRR